MYKRAQILLEDWQDAYARDIAKRFDLSFSEVIRIFLSQGFLAMIKLSNPEYEGLDKGLAKRIRDAEKPNTSIEERHKTIGKLYFEARKAVEYRMKTVKGKKYIT